MITVLQDRTLAIPGNEKNIGFVGDNKTEERLFEISDSSLFDLDFKLDIQCGGGKGIVDLTKTVEADKITLTWEVKEEHIPSKGLLFAQLRAFDNTDLKWHSETGYFTVGGSINATEQFPSPLPSEFSQMEQRVTDAKNETVAAKDVVSQNAGTVATNMQTTIDKATEALQSAAAALLSEQNAKKSEDAAKNSETNAYDSMQKVVQAMTDLLAMLGTNIATLTDGKLTPSQIPSLSINDVFTVTNTDEMLTLTAQRGDCALITVDGNVSDSYLLAADDPTVLDNWKRLGVSWVANAGHANTADSSTNANMINNHRIVTMTESQYAGAALDDNTLYAVYPDEV